VLYCDIVGGSEEDVCVPNPMHAEELYSYPTKNWMHNLPTWGCASMRLSGEACDAYQDGSTNLAESGFKWENQDEQWKIHKKSPALAVRFKSTNFNTNYRCYIAQREVLPQIVSWASTNSTRRSNQETTPAAKDADSSVDMQQVGWGKASPGIDQLSRLRDQLSSAILSTGNYSSAREAWRVISAKRGVSSTL
jgi:hypothetical protein